MLEVTAFTGLGPGQHDVVVTGCEVRPSKAGGTYLWWQFTGAEGKTTSAITDVAMTPGNKTGRWFASLTGKPTVIGESRALTEVFGKAATIEMVINAEGYPKITALMGRQTSPKRAQRPVGETVADSEAQVVEAPDEAVSDELPF